MGSDGLEIFHLTAEQLEQALIQLRNGERPDGERLEELPQSARSLAFCLKTQGKGWMLLDVGAKQFSTPEHVSPEPDTNPEESQGDDEEGDEALEQIVQNCLERYPDFDARMRPWQELRDALSSFMEDGKEISLVADDVRRGIAVNLSEMLSREMIKRMRLDELLLGNSPVLESSRPERISSPEQISELKSIVNELKGALRDAGGDAPNLKVRLGQALSGGKAYEDLAFLIPGQHSLASSRAQRARLSGEIADHREDYFKETGITVPIVHLREHEFEDRQSELVVAYRRKELGAFQLPNHPEKATSKVLKDFFEFVEEHKTRWLTVGTTHDSLDRLNGSQPGLVAAFQRSGGTVQELCRLQRKLAQAGQSVRDLATILEAIIECEPDELWEELLGRLSGPELY
jgi:hypothetical protein